MKGINIYLADGDYNGPIIMSSTTSNFSAVRVEKTQVSQYATELDAPGVYLLLVDSGSVYVGQSGLDTVGKRIVNTHSGSIDSSWHTVVGFMTNTKTISSNELLYIENALCEYVHTNFPKCLTVTPSKANCNASYRKVHYKLSIGQIHSCDQYVADIKYSISCFPNSVFPQKYQAPAATLTNLELFHFASAKCDVDGKAEIQTHLGHTGARKAILKAGSKVSIDVSDAFGSSASIKAHRKQLETQGKLINRVLQEDIVFDSQSGAGQFLNGTSFDGNSNWKRVSDNTPLKNLLQ